MGYQRIYYEKSTGNIITRLTATGDYVERTVEEEVESFKVLSERNRDTFDVIELSYGEYAQDFAESNNQRVNIKTGELEFSYPDPNESEAPHVFRQPLSLEVEKLKAEDLNNKEAIAELYLLSMGGF